MCYNKQTSLTSFIMSYAIASYLWTRNINYDRWFSIFLFCFSTNQFFDFLLWSDFEITGFKNITRLNLLVSCVLLPIFLSSQFLVQLFGKYYYENKNIGEAFKKLNPINNLTSLIFTIFTLIFFITYISNCGPTGLSKNGHLLWSGITKNTLSFRGMVIPLLFLLFLMYPYLEYINKSPSIKLSIIFGTVTLLWSFFCTDTWGSMWCWIGNFFSIIMLFSPYLDRVK